MKTKQPTIQQLVEIIREYNIARAHELSQKPTSGWPTGYKNILLDALCDCAELAAKQLKPALEIKIASRK